MTEWESELERWLKPFLDRLGHKTRQRMCPVYIAGLIGPDDRKSVQPMAERLATGSYDQLHHFIADGVWDATPLESELLKQADRLVGGNDAVLAIDDTAMPKKGDRSVGVAAQYASALGKTANCQTLVSLTLARDEVPVMVALRLFLPESWTSDAPRLKRARVPAEYRTPRSKPEIALGGAAVDVGSDLLGVGARATVLAGHLLNSFVRNSESRRERLFSRYQHDTNKSAGWDRMRTNGDAHRCTRKSLFFRGFRALREQSRTFWNGPEQPSWCLDQNRTQL